jgi:hypothetical protein
MGDIQYQLVDVQLKIIGKKVQLKKRENFIDICQTWENLIIAPTIAT